MEYNSQRFYPTYKFENRDVALEELKDAISISSSQSKLYLQITNILFAVVSIATGLVLSKSDISQSQILSGISGWYICTLCSLIGLSITFYLAEIHKTIVINQRKVITLRTILGLDYGKLLLTLPRWRVEGATNPFKILLFKGWISFLVMPVYIISISVFGVWALLANSLEDSALVMLAYLIGAIVSIITIARFRMSLNDFPMTWSISMFCLVMRFFGLKIKKDIPYVVYRATLHITETQRLNYYTLNIKEIVIAVEDKHFRNHFGVNYKSLARAILSQTSFFRKRYNLRRSGGSTITMQLVRTLFIIDYHKKWKRKFAEVFLARWIEGHIGKDQILNMYIASVMFTPLRYGLIPSANFLFNKKRKLSPEESFILVERLSNINNEIVHDRILNKLETVQNAGIPINPNETKKLYNKLISEGKLTGQQML